MLGMHLDDMESHSQHFIFIITCEWAQKAKVLVPGNSFQSGVMQH
jgi:hypothetical protein